MANFCENCGAQMSQDAKFCRGCGAANAGQTAAQEAARAAEAQSRAQISAAAQSRNRKLKILGIVIVCVIVLFYGGSALLLNTGLLDRIPRFKPESDLAREERERMAVPVDITQPGALSGTFYIVQGIFHSEYEGYDSPITPDGLGLAYTIDFELRQISDTEYESVSSGDKETLSHGSVGLVLPDRGFQAEMITEKIHVRVTGATTAVLTYAGSEDMPFELEFSRGPDSNLRGHGIIDGTAQGGTYAKMRVLHFPEGEWPFFQREDEPGEGGSYDIYLGDDGYYHFVEPEE